MDKKCFGGAPKELVVVFLSRFGEGRNTKQKNVKPRKNLRDDFAGGKTKTLSGIVKNTLFLW